MPDGAFCIWLSLCDFLASTVLFLCWNPLELERYGWTHIGPAEPVMGYWVMRSPNIQSKALQDQYESDRSALEL